MAVLPNNPKPARISELLADLDHWARRLTPGSYSSDDLRFWSVAKLPRELWDECWSTAPSDHWDGGLRVLLGDSESWEPEKVGGCGWTRCPRNSVSSHVAQDTAGS